MVSSLAFLSTRLHSYYERKDYIDYMANVEREVGVGLEHYAPALPKMTRLTRVAAWMCFGIAFSQVTLGLMDNEIAREACLAGAATGVLVLAVLVHRTLNLYAEVVDIFRRDRQREAQKQAAARRVS